MSTVYLYISFGFGGIPAVKQGTGQLLDKEAYEQAHEKRGDNRADSRKSRHSGESSATGKIQRDAEQNTAQVGNDADVFERYSAASVGKYQRDCVIGGYAEVGGDVERRGHAQRDDAEQKASCAKKQRRGREERLQQRIGILDHIAQQKQINKGCNINLSPVENQGEEQQNGVYNNVKRAERQGNE